MKIGIAAAGTGGHVFPALAVADGLRTHGFAHDDLIFFGGDRMEATTVPAAGYPFIGVDIHGIRRSLSMDNLTLPAKVKRARDTIVATIRDQDIAAMVVFGGYIAGPAALAASKARIPLIIHEANAVPGLANKMISRRATTTYVAFAPALEKLPNARVIGSPLRQDLATFDRASRRSPARERYGIGADALVLGVVGGSLGAAFLNGVVDTMIDEGHDFTILHVTGRDHHEAIAARAASDPAWVPIPFEDNMADLYAASDLVLSRGGALTVSEIQATRTPAVIVPLPAGRGYQARNAEDLAESGGAVVIDQTTPETAASTVLDILNSDEARTAMGEADSGVDHRMATGVMVAAIVEAAHA